MNDVTTLNILEVDIEDLREYSFAMIQLHVDYLSLDKDKFLYLLGYYPAIYNHFAELYTFLIGKVRDATDRKDHSSASKYRDKRDILEMALKSTKLQYESISRKITILTSEGDHD